MVRVDNGLSEVVSSRRAKTNAEIMEYTRPEVSVRWEDCNK